MNNKITLTTLHLGNSRVLGALCQEQDVDQILVLFGGRGRKHTTKGHKGTSGVMKLFIVVMVILLYIFVRTQNCIAKKSLCKYFPNTPDLKKCVERKGPGSIPD